MELISKAKENQCYIKNNAYYIVTGEFLLEQQMPALSRAFLKALDSRCPLILIDCSHLQKISVATCRVLLYFLGTLPENKLTLALFSLHPEIEQKLREAGLTSLLTICRTETEALGLLPA